MSAEGLVFRQEDRDAVFGSGDVEAFRKRSRILAVQIDEDFVVHTDRGPMQGHAGDWLVTNHPEDDPESDLWSISDERMVNTYELVE